MNINRCRLMTAFTIAMLSTLVILFGGGTARGQHIPWDRTLTTDQVTIKQGQTARLEVANTSNESLIVWLFFRDSAGKVLVQKQVSIKPGASEALEYVIADSKPIMNTGENTKTQQPGSEGFVLTALVREGPWFKADSSTHPNPGNKPTLYVIDNMQPVRLIGAESFKEVSLKTDFPNTLAVGEHPPLKSAELRPGNDPRSYVTSEILKLERGQVAQLELKNTNESVAARLQFVDEQGKILIQRNATMSPGGNELLELPGGPMFVPVSAQFGAAPASLLLLRPTLRIIEKQSGNTIRLIGPESLKELRPGNDPRPAPDTDH